MKRNERERVKRERGKSFSGYEKEKSNDQDPRTEGSQYSRNKGKTRKGDANSEGKGVKGCLEMIAKGLAAK